MNFLLFSTIKYLTSVTMALLPLLLFFSGFVYSVEGSRPAPSAGKLLDPFDPSVPWVVSEKEKTLRVIWDYVNHNKWAVATRYKDFESTVKANNAGIDPGVLNKNQVIKLNGALNLTTQKKKQDCLRQVLLDQTGVMCDPNPSYMISLNPNRLQIVKNAVPHGNGIAVSTLLAIWQQEGKMQLPSSWLSQYENVEYAKTYARENIYFKTMGMDYACYYVAGPDDNQLIDDPAVAGPHFTVVASGLGGASVPINIMNALTVVPYLGSTRLKSKILTSDNFFSYSLGMGGHYFQSQLVPDGIDISYMHWNLKPAVWMEMLNSIAASPARRSLGFKVWAIHSPIPPPKSGVNEFNQPRRNAVRFHFFRSSFKQYDG